MSDDPERRFLLDLAVLSVSRLALYLFCALALFFCFYIVFGLLTGVGPPQGNYHL